MMKKKSQHGQASVSGVFVGKQVCFSVPMGGKKGRFIGCGRQRKTRTENDVTRDRRGQKSRERES